jgi:hypothetical protein
MANLIKSRNGKRRPATREHVLMDAVENTKVADVLEHHGHVSDVLQSKALGCESFAYHVVRIDRLRGDGTLATIGVAAPSREKTLILP